MKKLTIETIRSWKPCYDPTKYLNEDWTGTVLDLLDNKVIPIQDRFWCVLRTDFLSEKLLRLFAVWCARSVQHLMEDERSIKAIDVAEAFANGRATEEELRAARAAASAAYDTVCAAVMYAASADDSAAARAARAAASAASAAYDADCAAVMDAACAAASAAARVAQVAKLREMIIDGVKTGEVVMS